MKKKRWFECIRWEGGEGIVQNWAASPFKVESRQEDEARVDQLDEEEDEDEENGVNQDDEDDEVDEEEDEVHTGVDEDEDDEDEVDEDVDGVDEDIVSPLLQHALVHLIKALHQ